MTAHPSPTSFVDRLPMQPVVVSECPKDRTQKLTPAAPKPAPVLSRPKPACTDATMNLSTDSLSSDTLPPDDHDPLLAIETGPVVLVKPGPETTSPLVSQAMLLTGLAGSLGAGATAMLHAGLVPLPLWILGTATTLIVLGLAAGRQMAGPYIQLANAVSRCSQSRKRTALQSLPTYRRDELGKLARAVSGLAKTAERDAFQVRTLQRTMDDHIDREIKKATAKLTRAIHKDPMTGLGNRRYLDRCLPKLISKQQAVRGRLVAIAIDLDHFKQVNDTLGHDAGDQLILLLADLMRQGLREHDLTIRLGGDEFLVLMPGGTPTAAERYTTQLRSHFVHEAKIRFAQAPKTPNLSIGVACLNPNDPEAGKDLLRAADEALYAAKRQGRGRTVGLDTISEPNPTTWRRAS